MLGYPYYMMNKKVDWTYLSRNLNAIHLLEKYPEKIYWNQLSCNPNAIHLLAPLNHEKMKENMKEFYEELVAYVFNPQRLVRFATHLGITFDELNELY